MRLLLVLLVALAGTSAFAQTSMVYFSSPPGDFVGQGTEGVYAHGEFSIGGVDGHTLELGFSPADGSGPWMLTISNRKVGPPAPLKIGAIYREARRYPFEPAGGPGLSFSGNSRGCNQLAGSFNILELVYDGWHIAIDFSQSCEMRMPTLKGQWRYRSSIPVVRSDAPSGAGRQPTDIAPAPGV